jgi:hypothetical protein
MAPVKKENCSGIIVIKFWVKNTHKFRINKKNRDESWFAKQNSRFFFGNLNHTTSNKKRPEFLKKHKNNILFNLWEIQSRIYLRELKHQFCFKNTQKIKIYTVFYKLRMWEYGTRIRDLKDQNSNKKRP